jgi:glutaredoxin
MSAMTGGSSQCPYLIDENTDTAMFESADIIRYLYKTYALWTPPSELLEGASAVVTPLLRPVYQKLAPLQAGSSGEDTGAYDAAIAKATSEIEEEVASNAVVIYTYSLSPFCTEATALLDNLNINYKEISLGKEWLPGLIDNPVKRAALGTMTGQTSLPHVFVGGKSIGGIFSGTPGLVPALEEGTLMKLIEATTTTGT